MTIGENGTILHINFIHKATGALILFRIMAFSDKLSGEKTSEILYTDSFMTLYCNISPKIQIRRVIEGRR